ncbi:DUF4249 family protein [Limibacter armeniacum]|uniref:DUF4249 family protein n=1 Tax=Limibacter armeniacum TaxID=466084 RepID=UPI002FE63D68
MKAFLGIFLALLGFVSCESTEVRDPSNVIVVEAYLYAGQPVKDVRLKRLNEVAVNEGLYINDALVTVLWRGNRYPLEQDSQEEGNYLYEGNELEVMEGEQYGLEIRYNGVLITASTRVPMRPSNVRLSSGTMFLRENDGLVQPGNNFVSLVWDNPDSANFIVTTKSVVEEEEKIPFEEGNILLTLLNIRGTLTTKEEQVVYDVNFQKYGTNQVTLMAVDSPYVEFFGGNNPEIEHLLRDPTNIENGTGIFSGIATDTSFILLIPAE